MKCSCGTENPDVAQFCFTCGHRLTALAAAPRESAGLRVRAPEGTRDDGLASPTAQLDTARSLAAPMSSTDHALKAVGTAARRDMEQRLGRPVFLKLWARCRKDWTDDPEQMRRLGYENPK